MDQAHEQNNACVSGDGGAVDLTRNVAALQRWMVAGPRDGSHENQNSRITEEARKETDFCHHDKCNSVQITLFDQVNALTSVIEEMENPFTEKSNELLVLDTRDIVIH